MALVNVKKHLHRDVNPREVVAARLHTRVVLSPRALRLIQSANIVCHCCLRVETSVGLINVNRQGNLNVLIIRLADGQR